MQCSALTKRGAQCKRESMPGADVCITHFDFQQAEASVHPVEDSQEPEVADPFEGWPFFWSDEPCGLACGQPLISGRRVYGVTREEAWMNWLVEYSQGHLVDGWEPGEAPAGAPADAADRRLEKVNVAVEPRAGRRTLQ